MSEDLGTEIKIGADASGVEAGVSKAKRSLASLGQAAELVGKSGGEGLLKIGAGGEASARNVEKATKSMIASIQRQTVAFEAGGTSARQYQEALARMRGIDSNVLKPYLDQLDAARNKADAAAKAQNGLGNSLGGLGTAASLARGAITGMLAGLSLGSMFAFVKNINDGVDGLNDLKDATGASIENLSALEDVALRTGTSIDTVGAALVKFNQVLGDAKPGSTQAAALKAIGLSAEELRRVDPAEALRQTAVALSQFADDGNKARVVQELFGKSVKDVAPFLNDLAEKTALVGKVTAEQAAEAEKLNKQLAEMSKNATDLARDFTGPMVSALNEVIKKFKEGRAAGLGFMSIGWQNYKDNVSGFYSGMFGSGQPNTGGATGEWDAPEAPKPSVGNVPDPAAAAAAAAAAKKAAEAARREMGEQAKMMAELSGLSGTFAEDWARLTAVYKAGKLSLEQYTQAQADLLAKQPGIKAAADAEAKARDAALKASQLAADARNREADGIAAWLQAQEAAAAQALSGVQSRISGLQDEERAVALASSLNISLAEAIERVALARLEEKQAGFYEGSEGYLAIEREIAARKELTTLVAGRATREEATKAAREAEKEWKSSVEKYEDIFRQGFADMLNNGKDGWKSFTRSLVTTFKTTVADQIYKMFAQPFVVKLVGSLLGFTGVAGVANAATGGSNLLGTALQGTSLYNGLTSGTGVLGSIGNAIGLGVGASTTMGSLSATAIGSYATPSVAAMTIAPGAVAPGAGGMSGALAAIPGWGWALAGVAALGMLAKKFDDSGTYHTGGAAQYSAATGLRTSLGFRDNEEGLPSYNPNDNIDNQFGTGFGYVERGDQTISAVSGIAQGLGATLDGVAVAFGEKAGYAVATAFADDTSKDGAWGALRISKDGQDLLNWNDTRKSKWAPREFANGEDGYKEYLAAVAKDTRQVLLDMDLPSWADTMLESIGDAANMEQLSATLQQIGVIQTTFVQLGKTMEGFAGLTDQAFEALMRASGGFESLAANAGTYYENFYSEAEKTAAVTRSVSDALAQVGVAMPTTRDEFRALVESQLALGESGAEAVAALLGVSGAFASVVPSAAEATAALQAQAEAMEGLQIKLLRAQGDEVAAVAIERQKELQALEQFGPAAVAMQQQIYGIIDAAAQAEAALAAMNSSAAAYFSGVDKQQATQEYTTQGDAALDKFFGTASAAAGSAAISAAQASSDAARTAAASWRSAAKSIESAIENIRAGTTEQMDPAARYTLTKATLDAYTESALSGDVDAASKLAGAADDFLKASESGSTSQAQYLRDRVLAEAKLASVLASTQAQASVQDALASSASAAVSQLEAMNANLTGFSAQVYELLSKSYQGADRATAGSAAAGLAAMQANFESYFRDTAVGQVDQQLGDKGYLTRIGGDVGSYTSASGDVSYFRAGESALDLAKRIPDFRELWEQEFGLKLPAFAVGTNYVPQTGPALLHEGEAVIPKAFNPWAGGGQGNGEMLAELRALRQTNERLEARLASIEESNRDMATLLDNVTEGGNAMRSEVMA